METNTKFKVKFWGGPLHEHTKEFDREQPSYRVFAWTYEATGRRNGDYWVYVKRERKSFLRKLQLWMMKQSGRDPRLDDPREPVKVPHRGRNEQCYCASGKKYKNCHLGR